MKKILLVLIFIPSISFAQEEEHPIVLHSLIAANATAHFIDLATTKYLMGYDRGSKKDLFRETNILFRGLEDEPVKMAIGKAGFAIAQTLIIERLHKKKPKTAIALSILSTSFTLYIAKKNNEFVKKLQ